MSKKLNILFVPIDAIGHVNAAIGMAQVLIDSGHRVIFAINDQWKGRLVKYGIEEVLITQNGRKSDEDPAKHWAGLFIGGGIISEASTMEIGINVTKNLMPVLCEAQKELDPKVEELLITISPDVVIMDQTLSLPSVELSGIPWVTVCSFNPLMHIIDDRTPPFGSGLPSKGSEKECMDFRNKMREASLDIWQKWNSYVVSRGLKPLEKFKYINDSKWLNIYGFPLELDYTDLRPLPPNWHRFDNLKRTDKHLEFKIPDVLSGKPGKLIYLSMGSMGGADIQLMKRLIAILSKSKNRFIVSKGPLHDRYELADNMWGQQTVPQIQVLSIVDLVLTHGGNNSFTETLYFGKPMIVLPLFGDQHDNAQRIHEKGLGIKLNPYTCSENELLTAIEKLLNDRELNERLQNISKRIQFDNSIGDLPKIIENLVNTPKP